jgi:hypothetical protein
MFSYNILWSRPPTLWLFLIPPHSPFSLLPPLPQCSSFYFHDLILGKGHWGCAFPPRFHKWEKTCVTCLCGTSLFHLTWYLQFHLFSRKQHNFMLYEISLCIYTTISLSIHLIDGHLGWSHSLTFVTNAAINMGIGMSAVRWLGISLCIGNGCWMLS